MAQDRIRENLADGETVIWQGRASRMRIIGWRWRHVAFGLFLVAAAFGFDPLCWVLGWCAEADVPLPASDAEALAGIAADLLDALALAVIGAVGAWILVCAADLYFDEAGRDYAVTDRRVLSASRREVTSIPLRAIASARASRTSFGAGVELSLVSGRGGARLAGLADPYGAVRALGGPAPESKD